MEPKSILNAILLTVGILITISTAFNFLVTTATKNIIKRKIRKFIINFKDIGYKKELLENNESHVNSYDLKKNKEQEIHLLTYENTTNKHDDQIVMNTNSNKNRVLCDQKIQKLSINNKQNFKAVWNEGIESKDEEISFSSYPQSVNDTSKLRFFLIIIIVTAKIIQENTDMFVFEFRSLCLNEQSKIKFSINEINISLVKMFLPKYVKLMVEGNTNFLECSLLYLYLCAEEQDLKKYIETLYLSNFNHNIKDKLEFLEDELTKLNNLYLKIFAILFWVLDLRKMIFDRLHGEVKKEKTDFCSIRGQMVSVRGKSDTYHLNCPDKEIIKQIDEEVEQQLKQEIKLPEYSNDKESELCLETYTNSSDKDSNKCEIYQKLYRFFEIKRSLPPEYIISKLANKKKNIKSIYFENITEYRQYLRDFLVLFCKYGTSKYFELCLIYVFFNLDVASNFEHVVNYYLALFGKNENYQIYFTKSRRKIPRILDKKSSLFTFIALIMFFLPTKLESFLYGLSLVKTSERSDYWNIIKITANTKLEIDQDRCVEMTMLNAIDEKWEGMYMSDSPNYDFLCDKVISVQEYETISSKFSDDNTSLAFPDQKAFKRIRHILTYLPCLSAKNFRDAIIQDGNMKTDYWNCPTKLESSFGDYCKEFLLMGKSKYFETALYSLTQVSSYDFEYSVISSHFWEVFGKTETYTTLSNSKRLFTAEEIYVGVSFFVVATRIQILLFGISLIKSTEDKLRCLTVLKRSFHITKERTLFLCATSIKLNNLIVAYFKNILPPNDYRWFQVQVEAAETSEISIISQNVEDLSDKTVYSKNKNKKSVEVYHFDEPDLINKEIFDVTISPHERLVLGNFESVVSEHVKINDASDFELLNSLATFLGVSPGLHLEDFKTIFLDDNGKLKKEYVEIQQIFYWEFATQCILFLLWGDSKFFEESILELKAVAPTDKVKLQVEKCYDKHFYNKCLEDYAIQGCIFRQYNALLCYILPTKALLLIIAINHITDLHEKIACIINLKRALDWDCQTTVLCHFPDLFLSCVEKQIENYKKNESLNEAEWYDKVREICESQDEIQDEREIYKRTQATVSEQEVYLEEYKSIKEKKENQNEADLAAKESRDTKDYDENVEKVVEKEVENNAEEKKADEHIKKQIEDVDAVNDESTGTKNTENETVETVLKKTVENNAEEKEVDENMEKQVEEVDTETVESTGSKNNENKEVCGTQQNVYTVPKKYSDTNGNNKDANTDEETKKQITTVQLQNRSYKDLTDATISQIEWEENKFHTVEMKYKTEKSELPDQKTLDKVVLLLRTPSVLHFQNLGKELFDNEGKLNIIYSKVMNDIGKIIPEMCEDLLLQGKTEWTEMYLLSMKKIASNDGEAEDILRCYQAHFNVDKLDNVKVRETNFGILFSILFFYFPTRIPCLAYGINKMVKTETKLKCLIVVKLAYNLDNSKTINCLCSCTSLAKIIEDQFKANEKIDLSNWYEKTIQIGVVQYKEEQNEKEYKTIKY